MSERLSDEQVARLAAGGHWAANCLAREVQAMRALLNGGPCPSGCHHGYLPCDNCGDVAPHECHLDGEVYCPSPCPNHACVNGRVSGIAEQLEAGCVCITEDGCYVLRKDITDAVIAALRKAGDA